MLNITTIVMVVAFAPMAEQPILVVAIAIALGGFVQFAFQLPVFYRNGYSLAWMPDFRHPGLEKDGHPYHSCNIGPCCKPDKYNCEQYSCFLPPGGKHYVSVLFHEAHTVSCWHLRVAMGMAVLPALSEHAARAILAGFGRIFPLRSGCFFLLQYLPWQALSP